MRKVFIRVYGFLVAFILFNIVRLYHRDHKKQSTTTMTIEWIKQNKPTIKIVGYYHENECVKNVESPIQQFRVYFPLSPLFITYNCNKMTKKYNITHINIQYLPNNMIDHVHYVLSLVDIADYIIMLNKNTITVNETLLVNDMSFNSSVNKVPFRIKKVMNRFQKNKVDYYQISNDATIILRTERLKYIRDKINYAGRIYALLAVDKKISTNNIWNYLIQMSNGTVNNIR
jgi:hypothetical protein